MKENKESLRYNLRMSPEIHAALTKKAAENKRSLHSEIIQRLEDSLYNVKSFIAEKEAIEILEEKEIDEILNKPEEIGQKEFDKIVKHSVKLETKLREYTEKVNATFKEWQEYWKDK